MNGAICLKVKYYNSETQNWEAMDYWFNSSHVQCWHKNSTGNTYVYVHGKKQPFEVENTPEEIADKLMYGESGDAKND